MPSDPTTTPAPADGRARTSTARSSAVVAGWTLVSRATGLLRVLVVGALMGPTYLANIFQAGYVLPGYLFTMLAGPVLAMVMVPTLVRALDQGGTERARQVLGRVAGRLCGVSGVAGVGLVLAAPALAWTLVAAVPATERRYAWLLATVLILFVAPQVLLCAIGGLGIAAQQARGRFALAAAAPAVESLGIIATVGLACWWYGTGLQVSQTPLAMIVLLGVGSTLAAAAHAGLQVFGAARAGLLVTPCRGWRGDPVARDAVGRINRSIPVAACPALTNYVLTVVAATVPGGVLLVQLSYQVYYALSFLGARAVSMAALPQLSQAASADALAWFGRAWRRGLYYALLAATPPLCLLVAFAAPTADLLANGELRQPALIAELAACLTVAALAQLAGGLHDLGRQALFARLDDRGPRVASLIGLVVTVLVAVSTLALPAEGARLPGLIVAILAGETAAAATVLSRLRSAIRPEPMTRARHLIAVAAATVTMVPFIGGGRWLLDVVQPGQLGLLATLLSLGLLSLTAFAVTLRLLGPRAARSRARSPASPAEAQPGQRHLDQPPGRLR